MATGDNSLTGICVSQKWGIMNSEEYFIGDLNKAGTDLEWDNEFRTNIVKEKPLGAEDHHDEAELNEDKISLDETESLRPSQKGSSVSKSVTNQSAKSDNISKSKEIFMRLMNE